MEYRVYKLSFMTGVHFGKNSLDNTQPTFAADTLFSALCQEAIHMENEKFNSLLAYAKQEELLLSDAFPYQKDMLFLPKPMLHLETDNEDSSKKKLYKRLKYIPLSLLDSYLSGSFPIECVEKWNDFGRMEMKVSASVRG